MDRLIEITITAWVPDGTEQDDIDAAMGYAGTEIEAELDCEIYRSSYQWPPTRHSEPKVSVAS